MSSPESCTIPRWRKILGGRSLAAVITVVMAAVHVSRNAHPGLEGVLWSGLAILVVCLALFFMMTRRMDRYLGRNKATLPSGLWRMLLWTAPLLALYVMTQVVADFWLYYVRGVLRDGGFLPVWSSSPSDLQYYEDAIRGHTRWVIIGTWWSLMVSLFRVVRTLADNSDVEMKSFELTHGQLSLGGHHPEQVPWWEKYR